MGTLTALLNLSQSALQANQSAIDIASNNVANQNTPGYTREIATWQENDTVSLSRTASVGSGASVTAISQRDRVLDQRVQQKTQAEASSAAESVALTQLQSVFGISSTSSSASSTAIGSAVDAFFNSFTSLQATPADASVRQGVLSAAQTLAVNFNSAASQIQQQTASLNQQVTGTVGQVNSLTKSIAALNAQITSSIATAGPSGDAGRLEDQRQQDITQLSQYIGLNQTRTENNGLTLTTTNGALLVSEGQSYALATAVVNGNTNVIAAAAAGGKDITSGLAGGQLGGVLAARDVDLPSFHTALDSLAEAIAGAVNTQNRAGLDQNGNPGGAIFTLSTTSPGASATIALAPSVATSPSLIAAASIGEGATGTTNATALVALQGSSLTRLNGQTAPAYYALFLTQLGVTVASTADSNKAQQASLTQLTTQQSSQSGVSLDDEAAALTQYQRSYQAAAKVFSIVDQLLASALNLGQQTTVN